MRWSSLPFGQAIDATRSRPLSRRAGGHLAHGTDVWVSTEVGLVAPWQGEVTTTPAGLVLTGEDAILWITAGAGAPESDAVSSRVSTGMPLGMLRPGTQYRLTVRANDFESDVPAFVHPEYAPGWMPHLFDPAASFGLGDAEPTQSDDSGGDLMSRREAVLADVQEHYYARPPRIERGWQQHLIDVDGRVLSRHGQQRHRARARPPAAQRGGRRPVAAAQHELAVPLRLGRRVRERLSELAAGPPRHRVPGELAAPRRSISRCASRRRHRRPDVLAVPRRTTAGRRRPMPSRPRSPTTRNALETRPDWVHTVDAPNTYRGLYRGRGRPVRAPTPSR